MTTRQLLPPRRAGWRQRVHIGGQLVYLTVNEVGGQPVEIFIDAAKQGTFLRGVLDALARVVSVALQCDTPVGEIVKALRGMSFPPEGPVDGTATTGEASSVVDWIAQELEAAYLTVPPVVGESAGPPCSPARCEAGVTGEGLTTLL